MLAPPSEHVRGLIREFAPTLELALLSIPRPKAWWSFPERQISTKNFLRRPADFRPYENRVLFTYLSGAPPLEQILAQLSQCLRMQCALHHDVSDGGGRRFVPRRR